MKKLDVINMAMDYLGIDAVDSADNETLNLTRKANRMYDVSALFVLNYGEWLDVIATTTFTSEAAITNVWNDYYEYVYELPSDCLRLLDLDLDDEARYLVQGNYCYTNYYNSTDGITARYLKDIREESNSSLEYSDMLGLTIASRLAYDLAPIERKADFKAVFEDNIIDAIDTNELSDRYKHGHENRYWTDVDRQRLNTGEVRDRRWW